MSPPGLPKGEYRSAEHEGTRLAVRLEALEAIETAVWHELAVAVRTRGHAWRTPVLATTDGVAAQARTVILREVDAAARQVVFYTDSRSGKVVQIIAHPAGSLVAWCPVLQWQLRLSVQLLVEKEGLAVSSRWATVKASPAAQDYLSPLAPGSVLSATPVRDAPARRREHFAVVTADVTSIDWLELHPDGHRRAAFDRRSARWLQP